MDLTIHNALHDKKLELVNLGIMDGKIAQVTKDQIVPGIRSIDAGGAMISPAFIEPHFHLENSVMPEYPNKSGTLGEAIKIAEEIKDQLRVGFGMASTFEDQVKSLRQGQINLPE